MISPVTFLRQVIDELQKVTWPKQQEVIRLTLVVILTSLIVGFFIGSLDLILTKVIETVINK